MSSLLTPVFICQLFFPEDFLLILTDFNDSLYFASLFFAKFLLSYLWILWAPSSLTWKDNVHLFTFSCQVIIWIQVMFRDKHERSKQHTWYSNTTKSHLSALPVLAFRLSNQSFLLLFFKFLTWSVFSDILLSVFKRILPHY